MTETEASSSSPAFQSENVEVVVIGAGPAGMAAATAAARHGATVVLLDEQTNVGGQIYRGIETAPEERLRILGQDYGSGAKIAAAFRASGARHITSAAVWQITTDRQICYLQNGRVFALNAQRIILCTGALERPFPIPGWTLPGVMTAGAAQIMLKGSGMAPSDPVVLAGCGPLLYLLASQYLDAGVKIAGIVDTTTGFDHLRALRHVSGALVGWRYLKKGLTLMASLKKARVPLYTGASDLEVLGNERASGISFTCRGRRVEIPSSLVFLHQGVVPNTQITWLLRATHEWSRMQHCFAPVTDEWGEIDVEGIFVAGDGRGIGGAMVAALQGEICGLAAVTHLGKLGSAERDRLARPIRKAIRQHSAIRPFLDALYRPKTENRVPADDTIACRCEEVTAGDVRSYVDIGCTGPNQVKSYGRCGMGPCQGRQCGLTVTELIAEARGVPPEAVGYYRIRPPIKPLTLGELAHEFR